MVLGKILPFVLVGYVQMTNVLLMGWLLFGVPVRGSVALLYAITLACCPSLSLPQQDRFPVEWMPQVW